MNDYKRKLTLAVIYGNVENIMERFLRSFAPLVDEIVMVQAIGNQHCDASRTIALRFLTGSEKPYVLEEYKNKVVTLAESGTGNDYQVAPDSPSNWPHVDNFAAARQMAFDLASNEWVMWADTDDILDPSFIPIIRRCLDSVPDQVGMIGMNYHVPEEGKINPRERIVKKSLFKWKYPIHECLQCIEGAEQTGQVWLDKAHIVHMPGKRSDDSAGRNMRIIETIPEEERTLSTKFHAFHTMIGLERTEEAASYGIQIISDPKNDWGKPEKWSILLALAGMSKDENTKFQFYLQCIAADPTRREAYGEIALCELRRGNFEAIPGWTNAMMSQPPMQDWPWNAIRTYWGWQGITVQAIGLRANGDYAKADTLQLNHFKKHGAKISLLHATRRPAQAIKAQLNWLAKAHNGDAIEHIFAIDSDDELSMNGLTLSRHVVVEAGGGPVRAWNAAAEASHGQVLIQLSDDWEPPMHWDKLILERIGDTPKSAVLQISDGHRADDLICMAILTRARYLDQRYLFHPDFFSMYSDNWFSECAHRDGVVIDARDVVFEHLHPVFGRAEVDEVYARSNARSNYDQGAIHYRRLQSGAITSWDVHGWCDFRDLYTAIACRLQDGDVFVEVGSWKGQSIIHLAQRLQDQEKTVRLYAVDTFKGDGDTGKIDVYQNFVSNVRAADCNGVIAMNRDSVHAAEDFIDQHLAGVFIDAAHDYDSVLADLKAWEPKVKPGGIIAGHDIDAEGVQRALAEMGWEYHVVGRCWVKNDQAHSQKGQERGPDNTQD